MKHRDESKEELFLMPGALQSLVNLTAQKRANLNCFRDLILEDPDFKSDRAKKILDGLKQNLLRIKIVETAMNFEVPISYSSAVHDLQKLFIDFPSGHDEAKKALFVLITELDPEGNFALPLSPEAVACVDKIQKQLSRVILDACQTPISKVTREFMVKIDLIRKFFEQQEKADDPVYSRDIKCIRNECEDAMQKILNWAAGSNIQDDPFRLN